GHHDVRRGCEGRRPRHGLRDAVRVARALQAGRSRLGPGRAVRRDHDQPEHAVRAPREDVGMSELLRTLEAVLFLSPEPVPTAELAEACAAEPDEVEEALAELKEAFAPGRRGLELREVAGGWTLS